MPTAAVCERRRPLKPTVSSPASSWSSILCDVKKSKHANVVCDDDLISISRRESESWPRHRSIVRAAKYCIYFIALQHHASRAKLSDAKWHLADNDANQVGIIVFTARRSGIDLGVSRPFGQAGPHEFMGAYFRPHRPHAVHRCGLLLQMSHWAWSVCLFGCVIVCSACGWSVQKRLNRSRSRLVGDSSGSKKPWGSRSSQGKGHFYGDVGDKKAMRPFAKLLWTL